MIKIEPILAVIATLLAIVVIDFLRFKSEAEKKSVLVPDDLQQSIMMYLEKGFFGVFPESSKPPIPAIIGNQCRSRTDQVGYLIYENEYELDEGEKSLSNYYENKIDGGWHGLDTLNKVSRLLTINSIYSKKQYYIINVSKLNNLIYDLKKEYFEIINTAQEDYLKEQYYTEYLQKLSKDFGISLMSSEIVDSNLEIYFYGNYLNYLISLNIELPDYWMIDIQKYTASNYYQARDISMAKINSGSDVFIFRPVFKVDCYEKGKKAHFFVVTHQYFQYNVKEIYEKTIEFMKSIAKDNGVFQRSNVNYINGNTVNNWVDTSMIVAYPFTQYSQEDIMYTIPAFFRWW